jgi:multimeric flavodoxin WrbA
VKKILILNGSPRPKGNTTTLADQLISGASDAGAETEIIWLQGLEINPCDACDSCQGNGSDCVISDDMQDIYPKLRAADAVVIATPVYWFNMTAQIKTCLDRLYALESDAGFELKGKILSLLMVYGDTDLYTSGGINVIYTLEAISRYTGLIFNDIVHGSAMDIGDADKDPLLMEKAYQLGKKLAVS